MNTLLAAFLLPIAGLAVQKTPPPPTLKTLLLEQLRMTHNVQDWFVPASKAVEGATAEQASWKDGNANHSIAQLVTHLTFWNRTQLAKFQGAPPPAFSGNNVETFANVDRGRWEAAVRDLDAVLTELEKLVEAADDQKLQSWASAISHIATHNAYHTGQILYIRKQQGSWDPEKGVK